MLVVAPLVVGIIGMVVERSMIRFLYGRMIDTMLATWGLSLFLIGLTTAIFGNTTVGISAPLGASRSAPIAPAPTPLRDRRRRRRAARRLRRHCATRGSA